MNEELEIRVLVAVWMNTDGSRYYKAYTGPAAEHDSGVSSRFPEDRPDDAFWWTTNRSYPKRVVTEVEGQVEEFPGVPGGWVR